MFGHHNDQDQQVHQEGEHQPEDAAHETIEAGATTEVPEQYHHDGHDDPIPSAGDAPTVIAPEPPVDDSVDPVADDTSSSSDPAPAVDSEIDPPAPEWQHPGDPIEEPIPEPISDVISPAGGFPKPAAIRDNDSEESPAPSFSVPQEEEDPTHELIDIKQHALSELIPLIDELDQPPEEKFRTIMMMIQASDDSTLVKKAYEAAHSIEDEKAHAQALLDIVNEINYFTQPHDQTPTLSID